MATSLENALAGRPQNIAVPAPLMQNRGTSDMPQGTMQKFGLKPVPECAMNKDVSGVCAFRNISKPAFEGRHNPA